MHNRAATIVLFGLVVLAAMVPSRSAAERKTIALFNGKDLTNFYTWLVDTRYQDPDKVFSVMDQIDGARAIRVSGQRWGGLVTKQEFSNYRLFVEFRWGVLTWGDRKKAAMDSGILVHSQGQDGNTGKDFNGPWMRSIECQIIQGGVGDVIIVQGYEPDGTRVGPSLTATAGKDRDGEDVYDPSAPAREFSRGRINWFGRDPDWSDTVGFGGRHDVESENGKWTRLVVVCEGDRITNVVNGTVVNVATRCSYDHGKILFQSEGAEIFFRKIELTPLPWAGR